QLERSPSSPAGGEAQKGQGQLLAQGEGDLIMERLAKAIGAFRAMNPSIASEHMTVFLLIALSPDGITSRQLQKQTGLSQSAISRASTAFGKTHYRGKPGLDMLEIEPDPKHAQRHIYSLNAKGCSPTRSKR